MARKFYRILISIFNANESRLSSLSLEETEWMALIWNVYANVGNVVLRASGLSTGTESSIINFLCLFQAADGDRGISWSYDPLKQNSFTWNFVKQMLKICDLESRLVCLLYTGMNSACDVISGSNSSSSFYLFSLFLWILCYREIGPICL
jgi:hypothetical protein